MNSHYNLSLMKFVLSRCRITSANLKRKIIELDLLDLLNLLLLRVVPHSIHYIGFAPQMTPT